MVNIEKICGFGLCFLPTLLYQPEQMYKVCNWFILGRMSKTTKKKFLYTVFFSKIKVKNHL